MRISLLFVALFAVGCESPEQRLARMIDEAMACEPDDSCVLAGGSDCTCAQPVNEARAAEVDEAAKDISCCDMFGRCVAVDCAAFQDIRCQDGQCRGD